MAPSSSIEPVSETIDAGHRLSPAAQQRLLDIAEASLRHGVRTGRPLEMQLEDFPPELRQPRASFVTLHKEGQLRGCIGTVDPCRPLAADVAANAYHAAFDDPRFSPLEPQELPGLDIDISVLSELEPAEFSSEAELLEQMRPGIDGLVIEHGVHRGLFLPAVWKELPDRRQFLAHLKMKAGLPPSFWSDQLRVHRFTTQSFHRQVKSASSGAEMAGLA